MTVFDAILLPGRQRDQKLYGKQLDFARLMNRNFTILGSRLYSPNLKDVAGLGDAQLILISHTFGYIFSREPRLPSQIYRQMYGKLEKLIERLLGKLDPSNLVNTILYQVF